MASAHNEPGESEEAFRQAEQALAIDPLFAPAMANKAKALAHLGNQQEATSLYRKAFQLNPELKKHF